MELYLSAEKGVSAATPAINTPSSVVPFQIDCLDPRSPVSVNIFSDEGNRTAYFQPRTA